LTTDVIDLPRRGQHVADVATAHFWAGGSSRNMMMHEAQELADRYVAAWNETDTTRRRSAIAALWTSTGEHYVGTREVRGYDALEARIASSHEKNVRGCGNRFRAVKDARTLHNAVTFHWEMLPSDRDEVLATGLEFLLLDAEGRIRIDYQFIV
jgi:hypothetical protein